MARLVTLQTIADDARYMADQRFSRFTDDADILRLINRNYPEFYDMLVSAYGENYFSSSDTITITAGDDTYDLPDDFYKIIGVDFQVNNGAYITLQPYTENERNRSLTTNAAIPSGTIRLRYVAAPTVFTALTEEIDGISGWEQLLTLSVAIDMMDAEESDSGALVRKYQKMAKRLDEMSKNRDQSMPGRISDIYTSNIINTYGALKYRLYGDTLELRSTEFLGANTFPPVLW